MLIYRRMLTNFNNWVNKHHRYFNNKFQYKPQWFEYLWISFWIFFIFLNIFLDILNVFWGFCEFTMLKNRLIYKAVALLRITQYSSVWGILAQRIPVCVATEGQLQAVLFSSVENWPQELLGHCDFENLLWDITLSIFKKHVRKRVTCRYCNSFIFFLLDVMI